MPIPSNSAVVMAPKQVREYPLPASTQTHEIVGVSSSLLLVSQQTNSVLVKVALDPATGAPVRAVGHLMGAPWSGLHGLYASREHPGMVWATLQFESKVLLLDPVAGDLNAPPVRLHEYQLPVGARGPHCLIEDGHHVWASAKDSGAIVRIDTAHHVIEKERYTIYPSLRHPIFVAKQPCTGLVFATEIPDSSIMWIDPDSGETGQIAIPPMGAAPVGMIAGPDGNVWFALLGGTSGGNGAFGRINEDKTISWFNLTGPWANAAMVHLAWESDVPSPGSSLPALLLLASSSGSSSALNAVIRVTFNPAGTAVDTEAAAMMTTAYCMNHRVYASPQGWYVSQMMTSQIAHVTSDWVGSGVEAVDEGSDYFADFGMGARSPSVEYR
jgi:virginiamycin B lyase